MEDVSCPLCGNNRGRHLWKKHDASYERCPSCGLVYENPRFTGEELREFYSAESYYHAGDSSDEPSGYTDYFAQCSPAIVGEYLNILQGAIAREGRHRFLDIGCGPGGLVEAAQLHGWTARGLELSRWAVSQGRGRGLDIIEGTLESAQVSDNAFDIVSLFDVLEHLPDPREYVAEIYRILAPGGVAVVETPNVNGLFARLLYRQRSDLIKPRAHICLYSPETSERLFKTQPFASLEIKTFPWCRHYTPGYFKALITSRIIPGRKPVQLTYNESMRIVARK